MENKVVIASTNPVKVDAVKSAFESYWPDKFEFKGIGVPSGVADQPLTNEETLAGARNRVAAIQKKEPQAAFWVGVEGGVQRLDTGIYEAFGWMLIANAQQESMCRSASFNLSKPMSEAIQNGAELGPLMDEIFKGSMIKHKGGAVGMLTHGVVDRKALYLQPLQLALIPFVQQELYSI
jgi:inosine/xanthosine triphosphatase